MANEISVAVTLGVRNGNHNESFQASGVSVDQTNVGSAGGILLVSSATVQTIALGDVSSAGYAAFRNLSTATSGTAYIALGAYDGTNLHEFVHLRRGPPGVVPLKKNVTVGVKSYGTPSQLRYVILAE